MLDDLLLLRLWAAPDPARGETRSKVAADLRPVAADPAQGRENWQTTVAAAAERLLKAGCLAASGRQGARLQLSEAGRNRVQSVFRIPGDRRPAQTGRRPAGWAWWRDHYALPLALGGERADTADDLRSALLRRFFAPDLPGHPRTGRLQTVVDLLLAKRLRVTQTNPAAFRQAALRDWVRQVVPAEAAAFPDTPHGGGASPPAGRLSDDLPAFAAGTLAAARRSPTGRFGDAKVFVSHVWRALLSAGQASPGELALFKARLASANTAGLLRLSRADLAGAHGDQDVRESELHYLGEKFHFVRLD